MTTRRRHCRTLSGPASSVAQQAADRLAAETYLPMMVQAFHHGLEQAGNLSRWLLATLVAINGAAEISLLPLKISALTKVGGAVAFLIGILAGLGAGLWSLHSFKTVSVGANTMVGYWLRIADAGHRLEAVEASMKRHFDHAIGSRATHILLASSIAAFLLGCGFVGWGMLS